MKPVLVDSSVWIDFFRNGSHSEMIVKLAEKGLIATCGLIRLEIFPFLEEKQKTKTRKFFQEMIHATFFDECWDDLIELQIKLLKKGSVVRIPDLIIAHTCLKNGFSLMTKDGDFERIYSIIGLEMFDG